MSKGYTNPYDGSPTLASAYAQGRRDERYQPISDDERILLDMAPGVGQIDAMKWVGVVPDTHLVRRQFRDSFDVRVLQSNTTWAPYSIRGKDGRTINDPSLDVALKAAIAAGELHRKVNLRYQSTVTVERVIATVRDGEIDTFYGEHLTL